VVRFYSKYYYSRACYGPNEFYKSNIKFTKLPGNNKSISYEVINIKDEKSNIELITELFKIKIFNCNKKLPDNKRCLKKIKLKFLLKSLPKILDQLL